MPLVGTRFVGPRDADGTGGTISIRKSSLVGLYVQNWAEKIYDPADPTHHIDWGPTQFAVMAQAVNGMVVRVATFTTEQPAVTYVSDDPDGLLS